MISTSVVLYMFTYSLALENGDDFFLLCQKKIMQIMVVPTDEVTVVHVTTEQNLLTTMQDFDDTMKVVQDSSSRYHLAQMSNLDEFDTASKMTLLVHFYLSFGQPNPN